MWRRAVIPMLAIGMRVARLFADAEPDPSIDRLLQEAAQIASQIPPANAEFDRQMEVVLNHLREKRYVECLTEARKIIRAKPDHMPARFVAANAFIALNQYDAARTLLEQMLDRFPRHPGLLNNLAWLYATASDPAQRRPQQALDLARRALVIEPGEYHIWSTVSEAYFANREFTRALRAAEEALRMARERNADTRKIVTYEQQVEKCREAVAAYSIFD